MRPLVSTAGYRYGRRSATSESQNDFGGVRDPYRQRRLWREVCNTPACSGSRAGRPNRAVGRGAGVLPGCAHEDHLTEID